MIFPSGNLRHYLVFLTKIHDVYSLVERRFYSILYLLSEGLVFYFYHRVYAENLWLLKIKGLRNREIDLSLCKFHYIFRNKIINGKWICKNVLFIFIFLFFDIVSRNTNVCAKSVYHYRIMLKLIHKRTEYQTCSHIRWNI